MPKFTGKYALAGLVWGLWALVPQPASAEDSFIRSSVSPEFVDGLHAKYLRYIADKLSAELVLYPMPFARRVDALKNGEIDIMVGLKNTYEEDGFVYLQPGYEKLRNAYFVRREDKEKMIGPGELRHMTIGVTIDNPASTLDISDRFKGVVSVSSLEQKIQLLNLSRIDVFAHFESSAQLKIDELGLGKKLVLADYQPGTMRQYFIALSEASPLFIHREALEAIIGKAVANGDFARIRLAHEASQSAEHE